MLASIASQLKSAVGHPVVEFIFSDTKPSIIMMDTRNWNSRAGTGLARGVAGAGTGLARGVADLIQRFRNHVKGPSGQRFVDILSDSGSLTRFENNTNIGEHSVTHLLHAVSNNSEKTKVVVKFRIEDSRNGNGILMHEHMALLNLKTVENVVKLWSNEIYDVGDHKALLLCFLSHSTSDKEALM
jgi:hypothetical protein